MAALASSGPFSRALVSRSSSRLLEPLELAGHFGRELVVLLGHFDQGGQIVGRLDRLVQRLEHGLERLQLGDDLAGPSPGCSRSRAAAICCSIASTCFRLAS